MDNTQFTFRSNLTRFPTGDVQYYLNNYKISENKPNGYAAESDQNTNLQYSYRSDQTIYATYGMLDIPFSSKFRLVTGARIEKSEIFSENKLPESNNLYDENTIENTDILPSFNFTYSPVEDMNIRLALSKTLARPKFQEVGTSYYDYARGMYIYATPNLKETKVSNLDLRWEYFFDRGEKLAITGFYKNFENPIELRRVTGTQNFAIEPFNSDNANLYGVEVEFVKDMEFIPMLKNFTIGGNFTAIKSVIELSDETVEYIRGADPDRKDTRPMLGQAPFIINAFLGYENTKHNITSNVGFNFTGEKLYVISEGRLPYEYEEPRPMLNFNISKGLANGFSVELAVDNILDTNYKITHHFDSGDRYSRKYSVGRTYSISLNYALQ
jgi:TonB-dependent receptor